MFKSVQTSCQEKNEREIKYRCTDINYKERDTPPVTQVVEKNNGFVCQGYVSLVIISCTAFQI